VHFRFPSGRLEQPNRSEDGRKEARRNNPNEAKRSIQTERREKGKQSGETGFEFYLLTGRAAKQPEELSRIFLLERDLRAGLD
jgi:hypothetical protein